MPCATTTAACEARWADEMARHAALVAASAVRRAGLVGAYAEADCELGRRVWAGARGGRGAYLWGPPGTGKTYAACCAARLAALGGLGARKVTAKVLLDEVREEFDRRDGDRCAATNAARVGLLVLDDLGAERPTEWAMEELVRLVDARCAAGLPTVFTSNLRLGALRDRWGGDQGMRLASRVAGSCDIVEVAGPDRRLAALR